MFFNKRVFRLILVFLLFLVVVSSSLYYWSTLLLNQHIQRQLEMTSHVEYGDLFHSSVHAMLMDAEAYVQLDQSPLFKNRLQTNENKAQKALNHIQSYAANTLQSPELNSITETITDDYGRFMSHIHCIYRDGDCTQPALVTVQQLFDTIFLNYKKLHLHHSQQRKILDKSRQNIQRLTSGIFFFQLIAGLVILTLVLFYFDKCVIRVFNLTEHLAMRDQLTGLYNRHALDHFEKNEIDAAVARHRPFGVIIFDIDHFKLFNDTHGHPAGDSLLSSLAGFVQNLLRTRDRMFRIGGEEFLIILQDTNLEGTKVAAMKICDTLSKHTFRLPGKTGDQRVTVSAGYTAFPESPAPFSSIFASADACLYRAKQSGRNRVAGN